MRVHHIDCCSMCPAFGGLLSGSGSIFARGRMVSHCLLVETPSSGLVLVDAGVGTKDLAAPRPRLGSPFVFATGLGKVAVRPAIEHVRALGFRPEDVRHIVVTHLDLDHAGGLSDFPWAKVHVHRAEKEAALARTTLSARERYRPCHFEHSPDFAAYEPAGEPWNGFGAARNLPGLPPEILAVPLVGHTLGHACVAVKGDAGWLLHAGDAYFHRASIVGGDVPIGARIFERAVATLEWKRIEENHRRLGELAKSKDVTVFSAHDPLEFDLALQT